MAEHIESPKPPIEISESVRFYISPHRGGRINMKKKLTDAIKQCFPAGEDLHATIDVDEKTLTIKEM